MKLNSFRDLVTDILRFDPSSTLFIVSCTKEKIWDNNDEISTYINARKAYVGIRFKNFLKWYQMNKFEDLGYSWVIISGKYGFIEPDHPISWYDINIDNPEHYPISAETLENQVKQLRRWNIKQSLRVIRLTQFNTIIIVNCSDTYIKKLRECFKNKNHIVIEDFK